MKSFSSRAHIGICQNAPRPLSLGPRLWVESGYSASIYYETLKTVGGGYLFGITGCLLGPLIVCIVVEVVKFSSKIMADNREQGFFAGTPIQIVRTPANNRLNRVNSLRADM